MTEQLTSSIVKERVKIAMSLTQEKWVLIVLVLMAGGTRMWKEGKGIAELIHLYKDYSY